MQDINGHEMHLEEVRTRSAYQQGGEIVDEEYETMWVCNICEEIKEVV